MLFKLLMSVRAWNIAFRTAHIVTMGILLGGHTFAVAREQLYPMLVATVLTGIGLSLLEVGGGVVWFHQGRGLMTLAKLGLIGLVPWFWERRVMLLVAAAVLASIGSHMPARFRYYSVLYRQVILDRTGPGAASLAERAADSDGTEPLPGDCNRER